MLNVGSTCLCFSLYQVACQWCWGLPKYYYVYADAFVRYTC